MISRSREARRASATVRRKGGGEFTRSVYGNTNLHPPHYTITQGWRRLYGYNICIVFVCHPVNSTVISGRHTYNGTAPSTTNGYVRAETKDEINVPIALDAFRDKGRKRVCNYVHSY